MSEATAGPAGKATPSAMLHALAQDARRDRIAVSDLLAALGGRALAALVFVFAVPKVLPVPPGTSTILGAPVVILAAQLAFGRRTWLPAVVARRTMTRADFAALVRRISPWWARAERLLLPRAMALALPPMEYRVGLVCLLLAVVLVLPVPQGNMVPALAISLLALGILGRDGVWILAGLATAAVSAVVVSGVVFAMVAAALYFITGVLRRSHHRRWQRTRTPAAGDRLRGLLYAMTAVPERSPPCCGSRPPWYLPRSSC